MSKCVYCSVCRYPMANCKCSDQIREEVSRLREENRRLKSVNMQCCCGARLKGNVPMTCSKCGMRIDEIEVQK